MKPELVRKEEKTALIDIRVPLSMHRRWRELDKLASLHGYNLRQSAANELVKLMDLWEAAFKNGTKEEHTL